MEKDRLWEFTERVIRKARRESLKEGIRWALSGAVLLEAFLFLFWRLFSLPFWIFTLPLFSLILALFFPPRPSPQEALLLSDRYLGLEERLLTAYELKKREKPSSLSPLLFSDLAQRISGVNPEKAFPPRRSGKAQFLLLASLPVFLLALFLPSLPPGSPPSQLPLMESLLSRASFFKEEGIYPLIQEAQKSLKEGRKEEAQALLEKAQELTQSLKERDQEALGILAQDPQLSFLQSEAQDPAKLQELSQLTLKEREALAEKIEKKLQELPPGAIRQALKELASQLAPGGNQLEEALGNYSQVLKKESELSSLLAEALNPGGENGASPGGKEGEGQVSPGEGIGTQGGLPGKEGGEDQPAYRKGSGTSPQEGQGLVYVPQDLSPASGEELTLPQGGEGSYQVLSPQSANQEGKVEDFREVLPQFKERALEQAQRRLYSPEEESLILSYFQNLEAQK